LELFRLFTTATFFGLPHVLDQVAVQHWSVGTPLFLFRNFILPQQLSMVLV